MHGLRRTITGRLCETARQAGRIARATTTASGVASVATPSEKRECVVTFLLATTPVWSDNLSTCLNGRYPSLCNRGTLTLDKQRRADEAERAANLRTCLDGRYPTYVSISCSPQTSRAPSRRQVWRVVCGPSVWSERPYQTVIGWMRTRANKLVVRVSRASASRT